MSQPEVLVGVTGGIAAYKTATVVSRLVQHGCGVTVIQTAASQNLSARPRSQRSPADRLLATSLTAKHFH